MGRGEGVKKSAGNVLTGVRDELIFHQLPYFLGAAILTTCATVGTSLVLSYLYYKAKHNIGKPKLAIEINQKSLFHSMMSQVANMASLSSSKKIKPIFNNEVSRRITAITKAVQNTIKNGGYFQNVLFYGPEDTGISQIIAEESGMSYIKMSGGDLAQYIKRGEHVTELNKLMDRMEASWNPFSTQPWVLLINDAESLCGESGKLPSAELLELQKAFLKPIGTPNKKFMIILTAKRMEDLDPDILKSMDHKIYIGPPAETERVSIIKSYVPQFFSKKEEREIFTDELVNEIARQTEGFSGRSLFKLLNSISNQRSMTDKDKLTEELVLQTVRDFTT